MKHLFPFLMILIAMRLDAQITLEKKNESCAGRKDGRIEVKFEGTLINPTYTWTKNGVPFTGQKIIGGLAPGDYSVTVTAQGGCMAFKAAKVWPGPSMSVDISATLIDVSPHPLPCGTRPTFTYLLTAVPIGGTPPYYCSWGRLDQGSGECTTTVTGLSIRASVFMSDSSGCGDSDGWEKKGITKICPKDPNDITGPEGYDSMRWVSVHDEMEYNVRFENDPIFAVSSASSVLITIPIDDDVDPFSFRLGTLGFGDKIIEPPSNVSYFQQRIDYSEDLGFELDVTAGLDVPNNKVFWLLETIDPVTGQPPSDPTAGFLPVNDTLTGSGEGFVNFTCKPKSNSLTGEVVQHQASIVFDVNDPLLTNTWMNTIDAFAPSTTHATVSDTFYTHQIPFAWTVEDDPGGCGVQQGELFLSTDNVVFESQGFMTDTNQITLSLDWDRTYYYKMLGSDYVDNKETSSSDSFYIIPHRAIEFVTPDREIYCIGDTLHLEANLISLPSADLYISIDSGMTYTLLAPDVSTWPYDVVLDSGYLHPYIIVKGRNEGEDIEQLSFAFTVDTLPAISIEGDPVIGCAGDILFAQGFGAFTWEWWPDSIIGNTTSRFTNLYADVSQYAYLRGTAEDGCSSMDSVFLTVHPISIDSITQPLCMGDSVYIGGQWITDEGFYPNTLMNVYGCDSVIVSEVYFESPCIWTGGPHVFVHQSATGLDNGTSWENAFTDLQDAIYVAGRYENVQEIWVAEGTYKPHATRRDTSFVLSDSIKIYGGFLATESELSERTADASLVHLIGDINIVDTLWDNNYHVLQLSPSCVECRIDGLTVEYGYADDAMNSNDKGAGIFNQGNGWIHNVLFEHNYADELGGAIFSSGANAYLIIEGCTFMLNASSLGQNVVNVNEAQMEFRGFNGLH